MKRRRISLPLRLWGLRVPRKRGKGGGTGGLSKQHCMIMDSHAMVAAPTVQQKLFLTAGQENDLDIRRVPLSSTKGKRDTYP